MHRQNVINTTKAEPLRKGHRGLSPTGPYYSPFLPSATNSCAIPLCVPGRGKTGRKERKASSMKQSKPKGRKQREKVTKDRQQQQNSCSNATIRNSQFIYLWEYLFSASFRDEPLALHNGNYSVIVCFRADPQLHWETSCTQRVLNLHQWLQCCLIVTRLVPRETAAASAQVLCTPYNNAPVYSVTIRSHIRRVHLHLPGCNPPLVFLAEWLAPLTCYCGNKGVERIPK